MRQKKCLFVFCFFLILLAGCKSSNSPKKSNSKIENYYNIVTQLLKSDPKSIIAVYKEDITIEKITEYKIIEDLCKEIYHFKEFNVLFIKLKKPFTTDVLLELSRIPHFKEVFPDYSCTVIGSGSAEVPISSIYNWCTDPVIVNEARAINISIGLKLNKRVSEDEYLTAKRLWRKALTPIVRYAKNHNKIIVLASGNYGSINDDQYLPDKSNMSDIQAWEKHVIIVGAIDRNFKVAPFSDKGRIVDIYAPGVDIYVPSGYTHGEIVAYLINQITRSNAIHGEKIIDESSISQWELRSGTSYAAPMVSGAVQFVLTCIKENYDKASFVKDLIVSNGKITHEGYPVLNFGLIIDDMKKRGILVN